MNFAERYYYESPYGLTEKEFEFLQKEAEGNMIREYQDICFVDRWL